MTAKEEYREIELTRGQVAKVSFEDFEELSKYKWVAKWSTTVKGFYALRSARVDGKKIHILMHRLIMGDPIGLEVDHIHGDTLDNRRSELRIASGAQNQWNARIRRDNSSGYKGVTWQSRTKRWKAQITVAGERKYLGYFDDPKLAHAAYCAAAAEYFGEFRRLS